MSKKPPPSEATLPAVGDSPACQQSTRAAATSATARSTPVAAVATTSPTAAADAAAAAAIVSKVSLSISFHIIVYIV
jgi:hypothetical protein